MSRNILSLALMLTVFFVYQLQSPSSPASILPFARAKLRTASAIEDDTRGTGGLKCRLPGNLSELQTDVPIERVHHLPGQFARGRWFHSGMQVPFLLPFHLLFTQTSSSAL